MASETPDLSDVPTNDLAGLMLACAMSDDQSDKAFAKACRDEIARRKPAAHIGKNMPAGAGGESTHA